MTTEQKVDLVAGALDEFGLNSALSAVLLPRSTWYYQIRQRRTYGQKYADLRHPLNDIAREHPEYGYRRVKTELQEAYGIDVCEEVVRRLHKEWSLALIRTIKPPKLSEVRRIITEVGGRCNLVAGMEKIEPLKVLATDFTELVYRAGKAYLMPLVDHVSKLVVGHAVGPSPTTELALEAWKSTCHQLSKLGIDPAGIIVHHDRDPVYTSHAWLHRLLIHDRVRVSYALGGAKDNTAMESFNSRFKNENRSLLLEAEDLEELVRIVDDRICYHNRERRHSTLGNMSPRDYLAALRRNP
jgi:transposase InsO family protein